MEIDKFIVELTKLRLAHGPGLEVVLRNGMGMTYRKAVLPRVCHTRIDRARMLAGPDDLDIKKGEKVVVLTHN